jgi:hypothetical protein
MRLLATWVINALALLGLPYLFDSIGSTAFLRGSSPRWCWG